MIFFYARAWETDWVMKNFMPREYIKPDTCPKDSVDSCSFALSKNNCSQLLKERCTFVPRHLLAH